jgi:hypothetical protein
MATSVKQMLEAANAIVPKITSAQADGMIAKGNTLILDVRDATEVAVPTRNLSITIKTSKGEKPSFCIASLAVERLSLASCSRNWVTTTSTISVASKTGPGRSIRPERRQRPEAAAAQQRYGSRCRPWRCH